MNVSKAEQRALHALAQGGLIYVVKDGRGRIDQVQCFNREGFILPGFSADIFRRLRSRKAIVSHDGGPYGITRRGLEIVRAQLDNR